ncbi:hypothetical protein CRG98_045434 [Punica granatum]|uniref:Uncharacterized protein n=1 Tax=Punica granatum TaxID=22663 RepID=A0A2I0HR05_PUNGR|nr:hypothetical protein CRG98_045434 [Punica granatum]
MGRRLRIRGRGSLIVGAITTKVGTPMVEFGMAIVVSFTSGMLVSREKEMTIFDSSGMPNPVDDSILRRMVGLGELHGGYGSYIMSPLWIMHRKRRLMIRNYGIDD